MKNPFKKKPWAPNLDEIHQYTLDLQRITLLRDKAGSNNEREEYDNIIHVMQQVLVIISSPPRTKL